jgi:hypothetical protein
MVPKGLIKKDKMEGYNGSLEFRAPCIHGNVDSYHDSIGGANSRDKIDSLNYMNSPAVKNPLSKKDSFYKSALQKGAKNDIDAPFSGGSGDESEGESGT